MRRVCLILLLLLTLPLSAQEDNARPLTLNDEAVVTVVVDAPAILTLDNATAGAVITITARAVDGTQVDPVLWLVDSEARLLAYNHNTLAADGLIDVAAAITNLVLPTAGLYTIYVDSFNGVSTGEVEVTIRETDRFNIIVDETGSLHVMRLSLPEDSIFVYPITVQQGDIMTITVRDGNRQLDPYIRIVNSNGVPVMSNDDHTSADLSLNIFDARITDWQVPADDTYMLEVSDFLGRAGNVLLEIRKHR
jgi:hypothetical protein